ncbi:MAG: hypothetical protein NZ576_12425, partial [Bacteroidia bacterium]|nr:hypothetical protein [Bacteroidia bacterium]
ANSSPYLLTIPNTISAPQTYYIESYNETTQCRSQRIAVVAPVYPAIPAPIVNNVSRCGPGPVTLTASVSGGYLIRWYDSPTSTQPLQTGNTLSVSQLSQTTTYYVAAYNANANCETPRVQVIAEIHPIPEPPVSAPAYYRCGPGTITLTATIGQGGTLVRWFAGGNILGEGSPFEYLVNQTSTLNVASVNGTTGCQSGFVTISLNIIPIPAPPSVAQQQICGPGSVTFTALMSSPAGVGIRVYNDPSSVTPIAHLNIAPYTFTTPTLTQTTSYYFEVYNMLAPSDLECPGSRTTVAAIIKPLPAPATVPPQTLCGEGKVTIAIATGSPEPTTITIAPTTALNATTILDAPPFVFSSDIISQTTTFVVNTILDGCTTSSNFVVVVNSIPPRVTAPPISRCGGGLVNINAQMGAGLLPQVDLLIVPGSTPLASLQTPPFTFQINVATSTTFYLQGVNPVTGCKSEPSAVPVLIHPLPELPITRAFSRCGPGPLEFTFSYEPKPNEYLRLYQAGSSSTLAQYWAPPFSYVIYNITTTTTYYLQAINQVTGCVNPTLAPIPITVHPKPGIPEMQGNARCGPGNLLINPGPVLPEADRARLYATFSSTEVLAESIAPPFYLLTPEIHTTTTFYVAYYNSQTGCESGREPVVATVHPIPATPPALQLARCGAGKVTFSLTPGAPTGNVFELYKGNNLITQITNAPYVIETPFLSYPGETYELILKNTVTGCQSARSPVNITVHPDVPAPAAIGGKRCGSGTVMITGKSPAAGLLTQLRNANNEVVDSSPLLDFSLFTPYLTQTTAFQVVTQNEITGCISSPQWVNAEILPLPPSPTIAPVARCGSGPVTLTPAMPNGTYEVTITCAASLSYNTTLSIGACGATDHCNTLVLPLVERSTNCRLRIKDISTGCISAQETPFYVQIYTIPELPRVEAIGVCGINRGQILVLEANQMSYRLNFWDASQNFITSQIGPSATFITPLLSQTTLFYVSAEDIITGCNSSKVPVQVPVTIVPEAPELGPFSRCGVGSITFTAAPNLVFYTSATEPQSFFSTTPLQNTVVTPIFTQSTQIYVARVSANGCIGARKPISMNIFLPPAPPEPLILQRCGEGVFTFSYPYPNQEDYSLVLYKALNAEAPIFITANAPWQVTTDFVTSTTTYYIAIRDKATGCESSRVPLQLIINRIPSTPIVLEPIKRCGSGSATLNVVSNSGVELWDAPQGGNILARDYNAPYVLTTPILNTSTTFYIQAVQEQCVSERVAASITILPLPPTPSVNNVGRCGEGPVSFTIQGITNLNEI